MKRALVTGATGAIGPAICRELVRAGLHVIVHGNKRTETAARLVAEIAAAGGAAEHAAFDVTDADATARALERLLGHGAIQVLVNNAGAHADAPMPGMTRAQWRNVVDVNLHGFFNVTQPLLLPMLATRWGGSSASPRCRR